MKGFTKEDHLKAMAVLMDEKASPDDKDKAIKIALDYQEQAAKDCTVCRYHWDYSSSEEGGHHRMCPYHDKRYGDLKERVRCFSCGVDCSLSEFSALGSTVWYSRGCYGSRLLDRTGEQDPGELRIEICDMCLLMHKKFVIDSSSGKWEAWDPGTPPEIKGDRTRIFQQEDGTWKGIKYGRGESHYYGESALSILEQMLETEKYMTEKGFPMGGDDGSKEH